MVDLNKILWYDSASIGSNLMASSKIKINARRLRKKKHLTQKQMARKAGLSKTTISNLEAGKQAKIELDTIGKLCEALECTPNDLFEWEGQTFEEKVVKKQKKTLGRLIGSIEYTQEFDPRDLDQTLAKKTKK